jgi:hypothetical protein
MPEAFPLDELSFVVVSVWELIEFLGFLDGVEIECNDLLFDVFDVLFVEGVFFEGNSQKRVLVFDVQLEFS